MVVKVFFSYSHKDETLRDKLEVHLAMLKRDGLIESWHDRRILAGDHFGQAIDQKLQEADVILLLLSPDFLASDYCYEIEKKVALERVRNGEAKLISVILRPCEWQKTDLPDFMATPTDGKPITTWADQDSAFLDVAKSIRSAVEDVAKAKKVISSARAIETNVIPSASPADYRPRSSNLRVTKKFSQLDFDNAIDDAFDFIFDLFGESIKELSIRNPQVEGRIRRIDAKKFTAALYLDGDKKSGCTVFIGGMFGTNAISIVLNDDGRDNTYNEIASAKNDEYSIFFEVSGMASGFSNAKGNKLNSEQLAELFWAMLIAPLQTSRDRRNFRAI